MTGRQLYSAVSLITTLVVCMTASIISGCGQRSTASQGGAIESAVARSAAEIAALPKKGKVQATNPPATAAFGMIYVNTNTGKEYIFDGNIWVPHDQTVETFYKNLPAVQPVGSKVLRSYTLVCNAPTGAHGMNGTGHSKYACTVCHMVGGVVCFDPNGPAYAAGKPEPFFDSTAKTCTNVACHAVAAGQFSYYFQGGDGEAVLNTVNYGSTSLSTPSWYSTGSTCAVCHGTPPRNGSDGSNYWHSGYHGNQGPTGAYNQCQFCHPDASSPNNGIGDTITNPLLHGDGKVQVQAVFKSACFGCH